MWERRLFASGRAHTSFLLSAVNRERRVCLGAFGPAAAAAPPRAPLRIRFFPERRHYGVHDGNVYEQYATSITRTCEQSARGSVHFSIPLFRFHGQYGEEYVQQSPFGYCTCVDVNYYWLYYEYFHQPESIHQHEKPRQGETRHDNTRRKHEKKKPLISAIMFSKPSRCHPACLHFSSQTFATRYAESSGVHVSSLSDSVLNARTSPACGRMSAGNSWKQVYLRGRYDMMDSAKREREPESQRAEKAQ